ncbi:EAL domain-containing protein [Candidatus Desantisbacteria bacterium]|nr:EAL domain-containing protein [Candidatus Desantisbacteria bacterium]
MNLFAIAGLSVCISCILLSLITIIFGKSKLHNKLLAFNIVVAIWGFGLFLIGIAKNEQQAILAWKIAHLGGFFIGPIFYTLVCDLTSVNRKKIIISGYIEACIFILLSFGTNILFNKTRMAFNIIFLKLNLLYFIGLFIYIIFVILSFYELVVFLKNTHGFKHTQAKYIIFGFMIGFIGGTATFLPVFELDLFYPYSNFGITIYSFILSYAILRYRLMDISMAITRAVAYTISAGLLTGIFIIIVIGSTKYVSEYIGINSFTVTVLSSLIMAFIFDPLKNLVQVFVEKIFYKSKYDYYSILQNSSHILASTIDLKYIYKFIIDTVYDTMKLKTLYLLSINNNQTEIISCYNYKNIDRNNEMNIYKLKTDWELIKTLKNQKNIIIKDELLYKETDEEKINKIIDELRLIEGEVAIPIIIEDDLSFLLMLGEKLSGDSFSSEDINLLKTFSSQIAVSLKNALLYDKLELLVKERTEELSNTNKLLEKEIVIRKEAEKQLKHQAYYDSITNLPNRVLFLDRLNTAIARKKRYNNYLFAVFFMDIDRFKIINDSLGHLVGDQLLIMVSERLKKVMRNVDTVARFGGDEFAILIEDISEPKCIKQVAERIHELSKHPFDLNGKEIFITLSIGITSSDVVNYSNPEKYLQDADIALYKAKEQGKACYVIFKPDMHHNALNKLSVESELRKAFEYNEFELYYQPLISIITNEINGFEAILYWHHPVRGLLSISDFIHIVKDTEFIVQMDQWKLKEACKNVSQWRKKFTKYKELIINVNISDKTFLYTEIIEFISKIINGIKGSSLRIGISEKMLINNPDYTINTLQKLRNIDIKVDISDFGSRHSALYYLRNFPINGLKIGHSFIDTIGSDKYNEEIVKTLVKLAHTINIDLMAEGIETKEQFKIFHEMQYEYTRGFIIQKPLNYIDAEKMLSLSIR